MFRKSLPLAYFFIALLFYPSISLGQECSEEVTIGSITYSVGDQWCGRKMDPSMRANPNRLTKLPDSFSYEKLDIYLDSEAHNALVKMAGTALNEGVAFYVKSGFRSQRYQKEIIRRRLDNGNNFEEIVQTVAPPGYSEHESGRAVDLASDHNPFYASRAYQWLKENAGRFGYRESYPNDNNSPILWEPWHWYYTGSKQ